jgi:hypothetical protein
VSPQEWAEDAAQEAADEAAALALLPTVLADFECETCGGCGEEGYEPPGWWHGSGVFTQTWPCRTCGGEGVVDYPPLAALAANEPTEPQDVAA